MSIHSKYRTRFFKDTQNIISLIAFFVCPILGFLVSYYDGVPVLVGVMLLGVLVVMVLLPEATTLIVLFVLYSNLTVVLIKFHAVPQFLAGSFFVLLVIPLLNHVLIRKKGFVVNDIFLLMLAYLIVLIVSALFSADFENSIDRIATYGVEGLILYFLILNTVRSVTLLRKAIWALLLAGILMGGISMYQEFTGSYDSNFGGLAVAKESGISTGEIDLAGDKVMRRRLAGPIGSKNRYAQIMVVLLPLALFRFWGESSRALRMLAIASCVPILSGALLTFSRGVGVAIFVVLIIMMIMRYIKVRHFLFSLAFCIIVVLVAIPDYVHRGYKAYTGLSSVASSRISDADGAVRGRATVNLAALNIFLDHPLLGVGPGQTNLYTEEYSARHAFRRIVGTRRAHNMYLEELADTGILGFALFMTIVLITLFRLARLRRRYSQSHSSSAHIAVGLFLAIVAYLFTAMFLHLSYVRFYWLLLALGGAAINVLGEDLKKRNELVDKNELNSSKSSGLKVETFPRQGVLKKA